MECETYLDYLYFLKDNATTKTELDFINKQIEEIESKKGEK